MSSCAQRKIYVTIHPKYLVEHTQKERLVNFEEAVKKAKGGLKVRRKGWPKEMWMTSYPTKEDIKHFSYNTSFLVHSHPYFTHQSCANERGNFLYVVEGDDTHACDWEECTCKIVMGAIDETFPTMNC